MEKNVRIFIKLAAVILLTILFIWLIYTDERVLQLEQPKGELIQIQDVWILLDELVKASAGEIDADSLEEIHRKNGEEEKEYLSYDTYMEILDCIFGTVEQSYEKEKVTYKNKYRGEFLLLKQDWYGSFDRMLSYYGLTEVICKKKVEILGGGEMVVGGKALEGSESLLGIDGMVYLYASGDFKNLKYTAAQVYMRENRLLTLVEILPDESSLENIWIMEADGNNIQFFYEGYELFGEYKGEDEDFEGLREQVATIGFRKGTISDIEIKNERISGKLLGISDNQIELEGYGSLDIQEKNTGYKLYEDLRKADWSELAIGYDFADFVLEDGKVCAFLLTRKEKMETIRVAIKSNNFSSLYHDKITLAGESSMTIYYGDYDDRQQEKIAAGVEISIEEGDKYLKGNRVEIVPDINTGKIRVPSLNRSQGVPAYRGNMEIVKTKDGLVLINEVLLEEYLYSVVPSEMPASYPIEALKAQAICARTYGYRYLKQPGYKELGAHVDDSVGYQVYNNITENVNSTKAVKETTGRMLLYGEEPVSTYYYSTSCGYGADAGVWNEAQGEQYPYLRAVHIAHKTQDVSSTQKAYEAGELSNEENFRDYIMQIDESAYEREEPWFRWSYQVEKLDEGMLYQRLKERYEAAPDKILTFAGKGENVENPELFEAEEPKEFKKVYDIRSLSRKEGGVMNELLIETDKGIYKVISEYNIRYVLNQGGETVRQDDSAYESNVLLPSAYFIIDTIKSDKNVIGYNIIGGGYGHGVGMSQNGARAMGLEKEDCESILSFYFKDCQLAQVY